MNLKLYKKQQSLLITGVSGSGKTQSTKQIVNYLCQENSQNVADADPIFEAFGNAKTPINGNSSRFCKLVEVKKIIIFLFHYDLHLVIN